MYISFTVYISYIVLLVTVSSVELLCTDDATINTTRMYSSIPLQEKK